MRTFVFFWSLVLSAAPMAALAQDDVSGSPSGITSDTERHFLVKESQGGEYELALAKLAVAQASSPDIKSYAQHVVADHEKAQKSIADLIQRKGMPPIVGITPEDAAKYKAMAALRGPAFDAAYLKEAQAINAQDKRDDVAERRATSDPALRAFANAMVTMDTDHLETAQKLAH